MNLPFSDLSLSGEERERNESPFLRSHSFWGRREKGMNLPFSDLSLSGEERERNESPFSDLSLSGEEREKNESPFLRSLFLGRRETGMKLPFSDLSLGVVLILTSLQMPSFPLNSLSLF